MALPSYIGPATIHITIAGQVRTELPDAVLQKGVYAFRDWIDNSHRKGCRKGKYKYLSPWDMLFLGFWSRPHIPEYLYSPEKHLGLDRSRLFCLCCVRLSILRDMTELNRYPKLTQGILSDREVKKVWLSMRLGQQEIWARILSHDFYVVQRYVMGA